MYTSQTLGMIVPCTSPMMVKPNALPPQFSYCSLRSWLLEHSMQKTLITVARQTHPTTSVNTLPFFSTQKRNSSDNEGRDTPCLPLFIFG